jgi:hypothetical protein
VLEFDDNDVVGERNEVVVFVRVGDVSDDDCEGVVVELDIVEVELDEGVEIGIFEEGEGVGRGEVIGGFDGVGEVGCGVGEDGEKGEGGEIGGGGGGRGISKISTISEYPIEPYPPPKNILFVDDVDAR